MPWLNTDVLFADMYTTVKLVKKEEILLLEPNGKMYLTISPAHYAVQSKPCSELNRLSKLVSNSILKIFIFNQFKSIIFLIFNFNDFFKLNMI